MGGEVLNKVSGEVDRGLKLAEHIGKEGIHPKVSTVVCREVRSAGTYVKDSSLEIQVRHDTSKGGVL